MTSTKRCLDFNFHLDDKINTVKEWARHKSIWDNLAKSDKNLFKQYISKKFLLKCWKKDIIFNLIILSKCSLLLFFNVIFPIEIILFINYIYIELRKEDIGDINKSNFCPCRSEICLSNWYNSEEIEESIEYLERDDKIFLLTPFEVEWNLYHCDGLNKIGQECHTIFHYDDGPDNDTVQDYGFYCYSCNRTCCIECQANDYSHWEDDEERCFECHNKIK